MPGGEGSPVAALEASQPGSFVCSTDRIVATDDDGAGLHRKTNDPPGTTPSNNDVTACVAADFTSIAAGDTIRVRLRRGDSCEGTCADPLNCSRPDFAWVFHTTDAPRADFANFTTIGSAYFSDVFTDTEFLVEVPTRFIVACRPAFGNLASDIIVDSISVHCPEAAADSPANAKR